MKDHAARTPLTLLDHLAVRGRGSGTAERQPVARGLGAFPKLRLQVRPARDGTMLISPAKMTEARQAMPWRLFRKREPRPRPAPINRSRGWVIDLAPASPAQFMRALPRLLPTDAVLVLEGVWRPEVIAVLAEHALSEHPTMRKGTLFPRTGQLHLAVSASPVLAELLERHPKQLLCWHFHALTQERILLEWWDAFSDPFALSESLSQEAVESFCRELGCEICIVVGSP